MKIPNSFKKSIAQVFYDKELDIISLEQVTESDGGTYLSEEVVGSIKCNIQPVNDEIIKREFGLDISGEVAITTQEEISIAEEHFRLGEYRVVGVLPFDSHFVIIGKKWKM